MTSQHDALLRLEPSGPIWRGASFRASTSTAFAAAATVPNASGSAGSIAAVGRIAVIDVDRAIRDSLTDLFTRAGLNCSGYSEGAEYLAEGRSGEPTCVVLGFDLADGTGLDFQRTLSAQRPTTPVIFQTAGDPLAAAIQAMKSGALDILKWPFEDEVACAAVERGLGRSSMLLQHARSHGILTERHGSLTSREGQVFLMVAKGLLNKQIAYELDLSEITVKAHRGRMMRKMQASSIADLVIMADRLGLDLARTVPRSA